MKDILTEFDRVMGCVDRLMRKEDGDIAIPVLTMYLAACGSVSGKDRADFKNYVCLAIDRAFDEIETRNTTQ